MTDLINNLLTFPTLIYTGLTLITLLYWLAACFGLGELSFGEGLEGPEIADGTGLLNKFKLDGIPVTISLTAVILLSLAVSFVAVDYYHDKITDGLVEIFVGFWVVILAPVISAPIVGTLFSPLKPIFKKLREDSEGRKAHSLIGHLAVVRTNKVTLNFGDIEVDDEGANLILKARAKEPNMFTRGEKVIITDYNEDENTFRIRPMKDR